MSNAALQGGAGGTGTVTLLAPSTSTDRTLTLPDTTSTLLSAADIGVSVLSPTGSGAGLTGIVTGSNSFRNCIVNGAMNVNQRNLGVSYSLTAGAEYAYIVDHWYAYCEGANATCGFWNGPTAELGYFNMTGAAGVTKIAFGQRVEQLLAYKYNNATATLSAEISNSLLTTVTWTVWYANAANTFGTKASPTRTQIATGTFTVTSTMTRYSVQISVPAAATTGLQVEFSVGAQTSGTFKVARVQLEPGSTLTPFEHRPYAIEFALCQRYYQYYPNLYISGYASAVDQELCFPFPLRVPMVSTPAYSVVSAGTYTNVKSSSQTYVGLGRLYMNNSSCSASIVAAAAGFTRCLGQNEALVAQIP